MLGSASRPDIPPLEGFVCSMHEQRHGLQPLWLDMCRC